MKSSSSPDQRFDWIDSAKGISIFLIVLGHCADKTGIDNILLHLCMFTGVDLFFLLSGMTFCYRRQVSSDQQVSRGWRESRGGNGASDFPWFDDRPAAVFLKNIAARIVVPYLCWSVVSILIYALFGRGAAAVLHSDRHHFGIGRNLAGMIWANAGTGYMEWNRPLWFLPCLAVVETIWFFALKGIVRIRGGRGRTLCYAGIVCFSFCWLIGTAAAGIRLVLPWELETALSMLSCFGIGRLIRQVVSGHFAGAECNSDADAGRGRLRSALLLTAALLLLTAELALLSGTDYADFRADRFSRPELLVPDMAAGMASVLLAAAVLHRSRILHYVGKRTMAILVMHKFPIMACKTLLRLMPLAVIGGGKNPVSAAVLTVLGDLVMAVAAILLCLAAERIISGIVPEVFGQKRNEIV